jgi:Multimeric flavodoxin WrbA
MRVLAIMGSPRKGDSYHVTKLMEEKMKSLGEVEFEYLLIKDANLESCRGCFTCIAKGEQFCPIKDDRAKIEEKMLNSDGVIFASPGYVMNISGLMKSFLERFAYIFHRPRFFNQQALLISTGGPVAAKKALKALNELRYAGFNIIDKLGITVLPWKPERMNQKVQERIIKTATQFYHAIKNKKVVAPSLEMLMSFEFFKGVSNEKTKEYLSADYIYYKDKKDYFIEVKVNIFKKILAKLYGKAIIFMMQLVGFD